jgi:hypothetical protein
MFVINGHSIDKSGEISSSANDRENADKVFSQMTEVVLFQLDVSKESSAVVTMYPESAKAGKYLRKVRVSHGDDGRPVVEGCK